MRKTLFILSILFAASVSAIAHTIGVGYAIRQTGGYSGLKASGKTACSAAILLGSDKLGRYDGNEIRTVRVSLANTKVYVDSVVVWVRQSLDGDNIASGKLTRFKDDGYASMKEGWNEVELDKAVALSADSRLYVGYTYYQRMAVCDTRLTDTPSDGKSFVKLGQNAEWTETDDGTLAIEAGVDGNRMPSNDIWLMGARGLILPDGTRQAELRVYNRGQKTVKSIGIDYDGTEYSGYSEEPASVQPDQLDTLTIDLEASQSIIPGTKLGVEIMQVNGGNDEYADDNAAACLFNYLRTVLVEEFTTEQCPNCPRVAGFLHDIISGNKSLARHIAAVCHHSGYHTDRFTTAADLDYLWFYNDGGGTYAPSLMYNRRPLSATEEGMAPTTSPASKDEVAAIVKSMADEESALVITANASLSADGKTVSVEVKGQRLASFGATEQRITVFLTEDNVLADGQAGSGTDTYYHQHVMRAVNATWGDPVEWDGDEFAYTCSFDINGDWKPGDLKVIAAVGDYDSSNPANCQIENSTVAIPSSTTGISDIANERRQHSAVAFYSLGGQLMQKAQRGICIVKYSDGTVRKAASR